MPSTFHRKDFSVSAVTRSTLRMPAIRPTTRKGSASRVWFLMVRRTVWSSSATMNSTRLLSRAERTTVSSRYGPWTWAVTVEGLSWWGVAGGAIAGASTRWGTAPSAAGVIATVPRSPVMCAGLMYAAIGTYRDRERVATGDRRAAALSDRESAFGGGKAGQFRIAERARAFGAQMFLIDHSLPQDLATVARRAVDAGADLLGVASGNGTQALVAEVAAESGLPCASFRRVSATTSQWISAWTVRTRQPHWRP